MKAELPIATRASADMIDRGDTGGDMCAQYAYTAEDRVAKFVCTRKKGHTGVHQAGVGRRQIALWDNEEGGDMADNLKRMRDEWCQIWTSDQHVVKRWETTMDGLAYVDKMLERAREGSARHMLHVGDMLAFKGRWKAEMGETVEELGGMAANEAEIRAAQARILAS